MAIEKIIVHLEKEIYIVRVLVVVIELVDYDRVQLTDWLDYMKMVVVILVIVVFIVQPVRIYYVKSFELIKEKKTLFETIVKT